MRTALICWFTGLSGAGKSTIAEAAKSRLELMRMKVLILDGDIIRQELNSNLGFSKSDIIENNRLILEICVNHRHEYDVILVPIIAPFSKCRKNAKKRLGKGFYVIYIDADIDTLHKRDTKGLYKQARQGLINNLIGVSNTSKYESPENPDLRIDTANYSEEESIQMLFQFVISKIARS